LIDLLFRESVRAEHGRDLLVRGDAANDREVRFTRIEALIRRGLRWDRTGECGDRRKGQEKGNDKENGNRQTFGHEQTSFFFPAPRAATRRPKRLRLVRGARRVPDRATLYSPSP